MPIPSINSSGNWENERTWRLVATVNNLVLRRDAATSRFVVARFTFPAVEAGPRCNLYCDGELVLDRHAIENILCLFLLTARG